MSTELDLHNPIHFIFNDLDNQKPLQKKQCLNQIKNLIDTLNTPESLTHIGGMLFKSNYNRDSETLHLGFFPSILEGERSYHYNIHLDYEDEFNILGVISATGKFKLLVKPKSAELSKEDNETYLSGMGTLALFLLEKGYIGDGKLDWATKEVLKALMGKEDVPTTIEELKTHGSS